MFFARLSIQFLRFQNAFSWLYKRKGTFHFMISQMMGTFEIQFASQLVINPKKFKRTVSLWFDHYSKYVFR